MKQICNRCVMDSTVLDIRFDEEGICNYCKQHEEKMQIVPVNQPDGDARLADILAKVKGARKGKYDCVIGLSGGVDSSYVACKAVEMGLKPLAVHFDNGWNSELAVKNIELLVKHLELDLVTYVIDWPEFKDIQRSFFKANVIDIEMVTDHAIFAAIFKIAKENKIKYILSGTNSATESIMPQGWQHFKFDLLNLKSIHKKFGSKKISNYPTISIWKMAWLNYIVGIKSVSILNYINYSKQDAIHFLEKKIGWRYYGGKHYESIFTKFYQSYILPNKFGVDKRIIHLSDLIMNGEISRSDAIIELQKPLYSHNELVSDKEYVRKKLGFSDDELEKYMNSPSKSHYDYPSYAKIAQHLVSIYKRRRYA